MHLQDPCLRSHGPKPGAFASLVHLPPVPGRDAASGIGEAGGIQALRRLCLLGPSSASLRAASVVKLR